MKKWIIPVVILVIAAIVYFNLKMNKEQAVEVQTEVVKRHTVEEKVSASGRVKPVTQVDISANVAGEIIEMNVKDGQNVRKGQVLAQLDKIRYEAAVFSARATYSSTKVAFEKAKKDLKRAKALFESGNLSQADLDQALAEYGRIQSNLAQAESSLKQAEDNLSKTTIISPIDGTIIQVRKEAGEIALGSQFQADIIMVVADLSKMEVEVDVNENDVVRVSLNDPVDIEIDAIPDTSFKGVVTDIANLAQSTGLGTQEAVTYFTVLVEMLEVPDMMRPGMSATVEILTNKAVNTVAVPIQSVTVRPADKVFTAVKKDSLSDEQVTLEEKDVDEMIEVIFRVDQDTVTAVPVTIGLSSRDLFEIKSGIQAGDEIVIGNHKVLSRELQTGMHVRKSGGEEGKKSGKKR
ncbi:MAG: efflux RND transporter periplasmic adaptor subunit [Candidatus Marinimicrobia bacterium]|nr:efflux RND transporter periplasmic adaptor subunit [Candidatus Neomarinimicrobiota bacterium]